MVTIENIGECKLFVGMLLVKPVMKKIQTNKLTDQSNKHESSAHYFQYETCYYKPKISIY